MILTSDLILYIKELEKRQNSDRVKVCGTDDFKEVPLDTLEQYLAVLISGEAPKRKGESDNPRVRGQGGRKSEVKKQYEMISSIEELPPYDTIALDTETT